MATSTTFREMTRHIRWGDDCPACGRRWVLCQGQCVDHYGGLSHVLFNDDCDVCKDEEQMAGEMIRQEDQ